MKYISLLSFTLFLFSCALNTVYEIRASVKSVGPMKVATFRGPEDFSSVDAEYNSILAAMADCAQSQKYARITETKDSSKSRLANRTNSTTSYNAGSTIPITNYSTSVVVELYPEFASTYVCQSKTLNFKIPSMIDELSRELIHPITKDFAGALLFRLEKPTESENFIDRDILLRIGIKRIEKTADLVLLQDEIKSGKINFQIIRAGKIKTIAVEVTDETNRFHNSYFRQFQKVCLDRSSQPRNEPRTPAINQACEVTAKFLQGQDAALGIK